MISAVQYRADLINTLKLPNDWQVIELGRLGSFSKGKGILKEHVQSKGLPCVRYGEIYTTHNYIIKQFSSFISPTVAQQSQLIKSGDLLFAGSGETLDEIGKAVAYTGSEPAYAGGDIVILSTNKICAEWLVYALEIDFVKRQKRKLGQGHSVVHIYSSDLAGLRIPCPPLPEQLAIASLLDTWDQAIQAAQVLIVQKELRKKWLMQHLLTGKKRLKGFNTEWKRYSYQQLLTEIKRPVEWDDAHQYHLISVRRRSGGIFFRGVLYGNQIKVKDLRTANEGDFLFSKMQIVHGASALVTNEFAGAKISGSYIAVVAKDIKVLDMTFYNWYSRLPIFYHQTYISSYGVHIEKMTFDFESFLSLEIKLPAVEEQRAIASVLQAAETEIQLVKKSVTQLQEQKRGLMQILLTGKKKIEL